MKIAHAFAAATCLLSGCGSQLDIATDWTDRTTGTPAANLMWSSMTDVTAGTSGAGQEWAGFAVDPSATHIVAISTDPSGAGICCAGSIWTNRIETDERRPGVASSSARGELPPRRTRKRASNEAPARATAAAHA